MAPFTFRPRDLIAGVLAYILVHQAWNRQESLTAVAHLAFFQHHHSPDIRFDVLDINGDNIPEGLVRFYRESVVSDKWKLQVLDLSPIHRFWQRSLVPFASNVVLESSPLSIAEIQPHAVPDHAIEIKPVNIVTGHVNVKLTRRTETARKDTSSAAAAVIDDRSRHFFCGTDWHDAAEKCGTPCPKGTASECPDGEKCYADTPCDYEQAVSGADAATQEERPETLLANATHHYHLTPDGGIPSVATLWSNGLVTLHGIAASKSTDKMLEVPLMWKNRIIPLHKEKFVVDWEEQSMTFVNHIDAGNGCGLIMVRGLLYLGKRGDVEDGEEEELTLLVAMNARTGEIEWSSLSSSKEEEEEEVPILPLHRGTTSMARRRSLIPNLHHDPKKIGENTQHCLTSFFRRSLLKSSTLESPRGALPFSHWHEDDAMISTIHVDLEQPKSHDKKSRKHHGRNRIEYGKPNVVVTHDQSGLELRSLRNGHSLCHLALSEERLYADFNHDGTLDSVHIAVGTHLLNDADLEPEDEDADDDFRFISNLAKRMRQSEDKHKKDSKERQEKQSTTATELCHLIALSGFPSKEELFSTRVCNPSTHNSRLPLLGAQPLLVEPMYGKGWDVVAAVNDGSIHRVRGSTGWIQWTYEGRYEFPKWHNPRTVRLDRLETSKVLPAQRPVILTSESGLLIISAESGTVLASSKFPQPATLRATLVDFDGDGTSDVIIRSTNAIWGYKIVVGTGSSAFLRVAVGMLLMGILVALLRNRFGPAPGKRSTDP